MGLLGVVLGVLGCGVEGSECWVHWAGGCYYVWGEGVVEVGDLAGG